MQTTLQRTKDILGTGLHSGKPVRLRLCPAPAYTGLVFRRVDCAAGTQDIPVSPKFWVEASLCTVLENPWRARVSTIEHLLAALHGCGVHNLRSLKLTGRKCPFWTAAPPPFVARILNAGLRACDAPVQVLRVLRPVR
jgi:UDP-3-O-[3-hydroxymyristoyl] N-acetylglucosamine deacetylase